MILNTGFTDDVISLRFPGLPVASAAGFRTRQFDISGFPHQSLEAVNVANYQAISQNSITTYVMNLVDTLNPYDPAFLRVDSFGYHEGRFSLSIPAQPGHKFILWKSSKLKPGTWLEVTDAMRSESGGQLTLTDPNATNMSEFMSSRATRGFEEFLNGAKLPILTNALPPRGLAEI